MVISKRLCAHIYVLVILGCVFACSHSDEVERRVRDKEIRIAFGAPIEMSPGVPFSSRNKKDEVIYLDTPHTVFLKFPSGKVWHRGSRLTIVDERKGIISEVIVTPLSRPEEFKGALKHFISDSEWLRNPSDPQFQEKMARFESAPPFWGPFESRSTAFEIESEVSFFAEIKPASTRDKWFLSYTFTVKGRAPGLIDDSSQDVSAP